MNEMHFVYKVRQHLNSGLRDIGPDALDRLAAARRMALTHQKQPSLAASPALATAGAGYSSPFHFTDFRLSPALAAIAFLLCAVCATYRIADRRAQEMGEIDSAILSDELPIGAFTDKRFAAWLKSEASGK